MSLRQFILGRVKLGCSLRLAAIVESSQRPRARLFSSPSSGSSVDISPHSYVPRNVNIKVEVAQTELRYSWTARPMRPQAFMVRPTSHLLKALNPPNQHPQPPTSNLILQTSKRCSTLYPLHPRFTIYPITNHQHSLVAPGLFAAGQDSNQ